MTWAEHIAIGGETRLRSRWRGEGAARWDSAERGVMEGGRQRVLLDAYRPLHGYGREDFSWFLKRKGLRIGRRFDHVFCSPDIQITQCEYLHDVGERGLSDHSALEVDLS